jgi:hypothetical protein
MDDPNNEPAAEPNKLFFQLTLDPASHGDKDTVAALLDVFPPTLRPHVGVSVHLTESVGGALAIMTFTVTVVGPAAKWFGKKVLGPPLEEIGEWLRDLVREFRNRRKATLRSITLRLELQSESLSLRIGVPINLLDDPKRSFSALAALLAEVLPKSIFRNADRVMLSWDPERECWTFTIWPNDMKSTSEYIVYDSKTGQSEKRRL